jgi:hypothetical protein
MFGRICLSAVLTVSLGLIGRYGVAQAPDPKSGTATVQGSILNKDVAVTVRLEQVRSNPLGYSDGYTGIVSADGSFRFEDVAAGEYRLVAEAPAYLRAELGSSAPEQHGTILHIKSGEHRNGLALTLMPDPPTICGHVADADGRPLQVVVEVFGVTETGDGSRTETRGPAKLTGKDGSFRFSNLWPQAKYFIRGNGVWYPSSEGYSAAHMVEPAPASRSGCAVDIQIPRRRCIGHRVHGIIQGKLAHSVLQYDVSLFETNPGGSLFLADSHPLYLSDNFDFDGVCPGRYVLLVQDHWGGNWQTFVSPVFSAGQADTTAALTEMTQPQLQKVGVIKTMQKEGQNLSGADENTASIQGDLRLNGLDWDQACPSHVGQQVTLMRDGETQAVFAVLDAKDHFSFRNLKPGTYRFGGGSFLHGAAYITTFLVDGKPTENLQISLLPEQTAQVEIAVSNDPVHGEGHLPAGDSPPHFLPAGTHPLASLSGKVKGLSGSSDQVNLRAIRFNSGRSMSYETTTAPDGSFHFGAVDPGIYVLSTRGIDDQYSAFGAKGPGLEGVPITLAAGQHRDGITVSSFRKSSLCGRVLDARGRPQGGWKVWTQGTSNPSSNNSAQGLKKNAVTDKKGYFHIPNVGPDSVLLWTQRGDEIMYYPSAIGVGAQRIDLGVADSNCSYEIRLKYPTTGNDEPTYHVRGLVQALDTAVGDRVYVRLSPENPRSVTPPPVVSAWRNGYFDVSGVRPGSYTLTVASTFAKFEGPMMCSGPMGTPCYSNLEHVLATQSISVDNADLNDVRLKAQSLAHLTGEILLDGKALDSSRLNKGNWIPTLAKQFRNQAPVTASLSADEHFSMDSLDEGEYNFFINYFWPEYYIQSISLDDKLVEGSSFILRFGQSAHLIVKLATDGASGSLGSKPTNPPIDPYRDNCEYFDGGTTLRMLIPDPLPSDNSGILQGFYNAVGEQHFQGVPPGHYRILAAENFSLSQRLARRAGGDLFGSHEFMTKLATFGQPVTITPKESFELTAPVVTESLQRLLADMGVPAE